MALTTEELLLLNNLMYMDDGGKADNPLNRADQFTGLTVREWMETISDTNLKDDTEYGSFMTGRDWKNIINSVKQNETLMNMTIATTHIDNAEGGGGGYSAVFLSENPHDAVVAFRGTAPGEWKDNFTGGNVADTQQQVNALNWYKEVYSEFMLGDYEVTVTGHSKGGNKSKYIALQDDTVDHCISFDGQGFSDKFFQKYGDRIAANQWKIENHNVDYDYVNFLLNDVGERTYYTGQELGEYGFLENHCPNTFMRFDESGEFRLEISPNGQGREIQTLDSFLNGLLRSIPDEERSEMLEMLNAFLGDAFSIKDETTIQEIGDIFVETITDPRFSDDLAYFISYLIKFEQTNLESASQISNVLSSFGMKEFAKYVDIIDSVLGFNITIPVGIISITLDFNDVLGIINGTIEAAGTALDSLTALIPGFSWDSDWALEQICNWIEVKTGILLSPDDLRKLLGIVAMVHDDLVRIRIKEDGEDLQISMEAAHSSSCSIMGQILCSTSAIRNGAEIMAEVQMHINQVGEEVGQLANRLSYSISSSPRIKRTLLQAKHDILDYADRMGRMSTALENSAELYERTEQKNVRD